MRRTLLGLVVFAASFVSLAFLALPVVAVFARVSRPASSLQLGNPVVRDALLVSLKTTLLRAGAHSRLQDSHRLRPRDETFPRPGRADHPR